MSSCNDVFCLEVCVCKALKSSTSTAALIRLSLLFCLCLAQGLAVRLRAFRSSVCVCLQPPAAVSSGPHNPPERVASFFSVTGCGPCRVAPGLQTNSVWPESLGFFFFTSAANDHRPRLLLEPRQRNGLGSDSAGDGLRRIKLPAGQRKRQRARERHANTKFNWFKAHWDR